VRFQPFNPAGGDRQGGEKLARNALTADRVLEEYCRLAFADIRSFFGGDGNLKPIQDLTEEQGSSPRN
jgi:hypothetical protein